MTQNEAERRGSGVTSSSSADDTRRVADEVKGAAHDVVNEARSAGASLRDEASGLGSTIKQGLSDQAEHRKNRIADRLNAVAERAERTADDLNDSEAWLGDLVSRGARELHEVADEIRRQDFPGLLSSVEVFARRQPALFMGASVALGFALTRIATARSPEPEGYRGDYAGGVDASRQYGSEGRQYGSAGGIYDRPVTTGTHTTGAPGTHTTGSRPGEAPFVSGSNI